VTHRIAALAVSAAAALACAACGDDAGAQGTTAPSASAASPSTGTAAPAAAVSPAGTPAPNVLPAAVPTVEQLKDMMEYFDTRLADAFARGDTSHLGDFLAGSELQGVSSTITVLDQRHQRNVFHVAFDSLTVTSSSPDQVTFDMLDHTTVDEFVDASTNSVLNGGLPGPQAQTFMIFLSYDPDAHAWFWTGAQNNTPQ
jgi:hypothetical protein